MNFRIATFLLTLFLSLSGKGQNFSCKCDSASIEGFEIDCHTKKLKDGSLLFYQFNCDSIWLTLQNSAGQKHVLYAIATRLHTYHECIGYIFYREFRKFLLFR